MAGKRFSSRGGGGSERGGARHASSSQPFRRGFMRAPSAAATGSGRPRRDSVSDRYKREKLQYKRSRSRSPRPSSNRRRYRSVSPPPSDRCRVRSDSASTYIESEHERKLRWQALWEKTKHGQPPRPKFKPLHLLPRRRGLLKIEYWERTPENLARKQAHMELIDDLSRMSREEWILRTTLKGVHIAMEPNLFPYDTPTGVSHYTLWSRTYLYEDEVESFVETWLDEHKPSVDAWAWDPSNLQDSMSVDLFHVHVYLWEPPRSIATIDASRTRSHRAELPLPSPSPSYTDSHATTYDSGQSRRRSRSRSPDGKKL